RQVGDRAELVVLLQRLRRLAVDIAVVLDAPGIDAAVAQRTDQLATGRACDEKLVAFALALVPDDRSEERRVGKSVELGGRRRHTRFSRDWSSDVCSSDLRQVGDRAELVVLLQRLRRLAVDIAVVLDAPGIDAAVAQRTDQLATGRACDEKLVAFALALVPDD